MAEETFDRIDSKHRVVLIISDGEDHEQEAVEVARAAAKKGATIFTVGVGTSQGAPVPEVVQGRRMGFKKDAQGNTVISKLNQPMLRELARIGNGNYYQLSGGSDPVSQLRNALAALEKKQYEEQSFTDYEDQYQWILAIALLLLVVEYFISERRTRVLSRIDYLNR